MKFESVVFQILLSRNKSCLFSGYLAIAGGGGAGIVIADLAVDRMGGLIFIRVPGGKVAFDNGIYTGNCVIVRRNSNTHIAVFRTLAGGKQSTGTYKERQ